MGTPRLEIDLDKIYHNAYELVELLAEHKISVTGITKATLGSVEIASVLLKAGVAGLGDSHIENIKSLRLAGCSLLTKEIAMTLIRSPMLSQVEQVVRYADVSCNTEIEVIKNLSREAQKQNCIHQILLMVELGDLREGIMPEDLIDTVRHVLGLPHILLKGIGTNLACRSGVVPDDANMSKLSNLANLVEATFGLSLDMVSGGNSANIQWALGGTETAIERAAVRIDNLRLGESIFLGCEPLYRQPIEGLHTDAIQLVTEVIESKFKPSQPTGMMAQTAFGESALLDDRGTVRQAILAIGMQDTDPEGLKAPAGIKIVGASSDHLVIEADQGNLAVGEEVVFQLNYSALVRAMTSPFISRVFVRSKNASAEQV